MKVREVIENANILFDGVYRHALMNPNGNKSTNIISFSSWNSKDTKDVLKSLFTENIGYISDKPSTKVMTILDVLELKFKTKKTPYSQKKWGERYKEETLSVVEVHVVKGEEYLDLSVDEFIAKAKQFKNEEENEKLSEIEREIEAFLKALQMKGITIAQYLELQRHYDKLSYPAVYKMKKENETLED